MALAPGTRLGPYETIAPLGSGGMGEVYRARDTRLDRIVAIKILRETLTTDPQFRERFDREARTISQLEHPHICAVYDVGQQDGTAYLVMQYLEGSTLADRIGHGAMPIDETLAIAAQMADALSRAHRAGIIHRDLKPGNVMLTKTGAKLLDFGIAKSSVTPAASGVSMLATTPPNLTSTGAVLGTFHYMAPESIEGRDADARTDIFAFGVVLYEMLTGTKPFDGKTQAGLAAAILEREPTAVSARQRTIPRALDRIVAKCLAKDPDRRWQTAADLRDELQWVAAGGDAASTVQSVPSTPARTVAWWWLAATGGLAIAVVSMAILLYRTPATETPGLVRFSIAPPEGTTFETSLIAGFAATSGSISPNGRLMAFTARHPTGNILVWVRSLDSLTAEPLMGTEAAGLPFWSPDSKSIGFFAQGKLKRVDVTGGSPQVIADAPNGRGATWNGDDTIIFSPNLVGALYRVRASGGDAVSATRLKEGQSHHRFPVFLPDGRHFLYYAQGASENTSGVFVSELDSTTSDQRLMAADSTALYSTAGYLVFVRQGALLAQRFDVTAMTLSGDTVRIAESIPTENNARAFSVSNTGVLAYRTGPVTQDLQFGWFDRTGKRLEVFGQPGGYRGVDLSPDGKRAVVHRHDGNGGDVWVIEPRGTSTRLSSEPTQDNSSPIWSPDGRDVVFGSVRNGKWLLIRKPSNGSGSEQVLLESELAMIPASWSPDGAYILYWLYDSKTGTDTWLLPLSGDRKPRPLMNSRFVESHAQVSPDGKWVAYYSDRSGARNEVYVKPFPSGDGEWQVSTAGGFYPRWRGDGKELFYLSERSLGKVMAVPIKTTGTTFEAGAPQELFDSGYVEFTHSTSVYNYHTYAVSSDGQRFFIPRPTSDLKVSALTPLTVVLNWMNAVEK